MGDRSAPRPAARAGRWMQRTRRCSRPARRPAISETRELVLRPTLSRRRAVSERLYIFGIHVAHDSRGLCGVHFLKRLVSACVSMTKLGLNSQTVCDNEKVRLQLFE